MYPDHPILKISVNIHHNTQLKGVTAKRICLASFYLNGSLFSFVCVHIYVWHRRKNIWGSTIHGVKKIWGQKCWRSKNVGINKKIAEKKFVPETLLYKKGNKH